MFLWVHLVMSMLEDAFTALEVKHALADLPEGLDKVFVVQILLRCSQAQGNVLTFGGSYDRIFRRFQTSIPKSNRDRASQIFQWLTYGQRPLKKFEIQQAIALSFENPRINADTMVFGDVFELCKPLVESGPGNTIRFVHISVKEFVVP